MKVLLAGCGDIGARVAALLESSASCTGLRRRPENIPKGIIAFGADFNAPASLTHLPQDFDYIVVTLTPSGRTEADYQRAYVDASQHLANWVSAWPVGPKRVFFVSSTSVYGQTDHSQINEQSQTLVSGNPGQLVNAEQVWLQSDIPSTVLRLSGIYGDTRQYFLKQVLAGTVAQTGEHYSNRIHIDDAARAIVHLIKEDANQALDQCYIVSDCEPVRLDEVVRWVHSQVAHSIVANGDTFKRRGGSKRCNNKALQATGFSFDYPTFREGYAAMLTAIQ